MDRTGVENWLKTYKIKNYSINEDLGISGSFYCKNNCLASLSGCPDLIVGDFDCSYNSLTSLVGCPSKVVDNFYSYNIEQPEQKNNHTKNPQNHLNHYHYNQNYYPQTQAQDNQLNHSRS